MAQKKNKKTKQTTPVKELIASEPSLKSYPVERGAVNFAPTKQETIKSKAYAVMNDQIQMQLDQISEQIRLLAKQAEELKQREEISYHIYQADIPFEPIVGKIYYLYQKAQQRILSMLSPEEWGEQRLERQEMALMSKVQLLADCTWKILDD